MYPRISVIIPVFNDSKGLEETLNALLQQNYPEQFFEIIVVDNCSTDNTFEKAKSLTGQHSGRIKILQERRVKGSYAARNKGLRAARGNLVCFVDANVTMGSNYLRNIENLFQNAPVDYLGCSVKIYSDHSTKKEKLSISKGTSKTGNLPRLVACRSKGQLLTGSGPSTPD
jgi:glycosyltransferase involved in cell wall biosynthesis